MDIPRKFKITEKYSPPNTIRISKLKTQVEKIEQECKRIRKSFKKKIQKLTMSY
jgi:hypothetical protein